MALKEYTTSDLMAYSNLHNLHIREICFVVRQSPDLGDEVTTVTDDLEEAKRIAEEKGYQIYIYQKKFAKECFDADWIFDRMIDDLESEGFDFDYSKADKKEFNRITEEWFNKAVEGAWFAYGLLGVLKDD